MLTQLETSPIRLVLQTPKKISLSTSGGDAGRKKKRVSRFDRASGAESPPEEEAVDNTGAIMPYKDPKDFSHYLSGVLQAEPSSQPHSPTWSARYCLSMIQLNSKPFDIVLADDMHELDKVWSFRSRPANYSVTHYSNALQVP